MENIKGNGILIRHIVGPEQYHVGTLLTSINNSRQKQYDIPAIQ